MNAAASTVCTAGPPTRPGGGDTQSCARAVHREGQDDREVDQQQEAGASHVSTVMTGAPAAHPHRGGPRRALVRRAADVKTAISADDGRPPRTYRRNDRRETSDEKGVRDGGECPADRSSGGGFGVLMFLGVEGEWLLDPQRDDGTVRDLPVFALLLLTATVGFALLFVAARGLRAQAADPTRPARVGAMLTVVGAGLLAVFGLTGLVTSLLTGSPLEASFLAFLLGMLLLAVGPVIWGLVAAPTHPGTACGSCWCSAGVAAFAALAIEPDPWHDVSLVVMFAAWSLLGTLLVRRDSVPVEPTAGTADHVRATSG